MNAQAAADMQVPAVLLTNHLERLETELRAQSIIRRIRNFNGEGHQKFLDWIRDMERARLSLGANDARMLRLALDTLGGPAVEYCYRLIDNNVVDTWDELKNNLKERYSDLSDVQFAKQTLRRMTQRKDESVQNFSERLYTAAREAYPDHDLDDEIIQASLVEIFADGLYEPRMARKLYRDRPDTLTRALELAIVEQQTQRTYDLRRGEEPMEVNALSVQEDRLAAMAAQMQEMMKKIEQLDMGRPRNGGPSGKRPKFEWTTDRKPICFKCKQQGHFQRDCPTKRPLNS